MPKYNDDFYYGYKPKDSKDYVDIASNDIFSDTPRDISSYSKAIPEKKEPAAPQRTRRTTPQRTTATRKPAVNKSTGTKIKKAEDAVNGVVDTYGNFCLKSLGNIIKVIAFIVAFGVIILSLVLGLTILKAKAGLSMLSFVAIIAGTVFAAILFFPLYGIGHIICQNNEILRIFGADNKDK
ncbi:MAG: hypothetical protein IJJ40_00130 [Clostridia bacterium]|nr:hypothetical protein [Clostridia bacterium]